MILRLVLDDDVLLSNYDNDMASMISSMMVGELLEADFGEQVPKMSACSPDELGAERLKIWDIAVNR